MPASWLLHGATAGIGADPGERAAASENKNGCSLDRDIVGRCMLWRCASAVEKAVKSVDPNAKVTVDLLAKTASIESDIGLAAFVAAIEDAG